MVVARRRRKNDQGRAYIGGMNEDGNRVTMAQSGGQRYHEIASPDLDVTTRRQGAAPVRLGTTRSEGPITPSSQLKSGEFDADLSGRAAMEQKRKAQILGNQQTARTNLAQEGAGPSTNVAGNVFFKTLTPQEQTARLGENRATNEAIQARGQAKASAGAQMSAEMFKSPRERRLARQMEQDQDVRLGNAANRHALGRKYDVLENVGLANAAASVQAAKLGAKPAGFETVPLDDPGKDGGQSFVTIDKSTGLPVEDPNTSNMSPGEIALEEQIAEDEAALAKGDKGYGLLGRASPVAGTGGSREDRLKRNRQRLAEMRGGREESTEEAGQDVTPEVRAQGIQWLKDNPNDPRAADVKKRLGIK